MEGGPATESSSSISTASGSCPQPEKAGLWFRYSDRLVSSITLFVCLFYTCHTQTDTSLDNYSSVCSPKIFQPEPEAA